MIAHSNIQSCAAEQATLCSAPVEIKRSMLARIAAWMRLYSERRVLAELDDRLLSDIGVDRADAAAEAKRPFWDQPAGR